MADFYTVKNWSRFQHYRDRNPPWVKLHWELLSSRDWVMLDDASRVLAVACMLVASRNEGQVPADPAYIKRVAYLHRTPNFKPLILCGFLESASGCKQMLATARPETEAEAEAETETEAEEEGRARTSRTPTTPKVSFSNLVTMTEKEHAALTEKHGPEAVAWMIEKLDAWKDGKGLTAKSKGSDAGKIRSWVVAAWEEHQAKSGNTKCSPAQRDKYAHLEETA